jgi:hypothetical protein
LAQLMYRAGCVRPGGTTQAKSLGNNVYDGLGVLMRKGRVVRAYKRFLELPVAIVLVVLSLAGMGLVGLCAFALYLCWILLRAVIGS